jgi:integrase
MEPGGRCIDPARAELHVIQQLRYSPKESAAASTSASPRPAPPAPSTWTRSVGDILADHVRQFPPVAVELVDTTSGDPVRRTVPLLFTTTHGNPFTDRTWSREWMGWRDVAGWPKEHGGSHALRHFATTLITNHAEPQDVQRLLRHKTLRITLDTYVHWWPKRDRARGVVGGVLSRAREQSHRAQDQT